MRHAFFNLSILATAALHTARAFSADSYQLLKDEGLRTAPSAPLAKSELTLQQLTKNPAVIKMSDSVWGLIDEVKKSSQRTEQVAKAIQNSLQLWSEFQLLGPSPTNEAANNGDDDFGLVVLPRSRVNHTAFAKQRPHLNTINSIPILKALNWSEMRQEVSSQPPTDDQLGGRDITEFCVADAGTGLPTSAQLPFSVVDIAVAEASHTSLDLALFRLLEQPDAFALADAIADGEQDNRDYFEDDLPAWQVVLAPWQTDRNRPKLKDLQKWWQQHGEDSDTDASDFIKHLVAATTKWNNECLKKGGRWHEGIPDARQNRLIIAACYEANNKDYRQLYVNALTMKEAHLLGIIAKQDNIISQIEFDSENDDAAFTITVQDDSRRKLTANLVFDSAGQLRGRFGTSESAEHAAWDSAGRLVWTGRQSTNGMWMEDISWGADLHPLSKMYFGPDGALRMVNEWHSKGLPAAQTSYQSGLREGLQQWWHQSGAPAGDAMWSSGKRLGSARLKFDNGITGFEAGYVFNQLDGLMVWRDELGKELVRAKFIHGHIQGPFQLKTNDTTILSSANFDHGLAEGQVVIGHKGQTPYAILPFKSGILDGEVLYYTKEDRLRLTAPFRSGKLNGLLKAFYNKDQPAAECLFDDNHIQSWQAWPFQPQKRALQIKGKLLDPLTGRMTQTVSDDRQHISTSCDGRDGIWTSCQWTFNGRNAVWNEKNLSAALAKVKMEDGSSYNPAKCGGTTRSWNISSWIDSGKPTAALDLIPAAGCRDRVTVQCEIALSAKLQVLDCAVVNDDVDSDHEE